MDLAVKRKFHLDKEKKSLVLIIADCGLDSYNNHVIIPYDIAPRFWFLQNNSGSLTNKYN
jgi:hypothetical protein